MCLADVYSVYITSSREKYLVVVVVGFQGKKKSSPCPVLASHQNQVSYTPSMKYQAELSSHDVKDLSTSQR